MSLLPRMCHSTFYVDQSLSLSVFSQHLLVWFVQQVNSDDKGLRLLLFLLPSILLAGHYGAIVVVPQHYRPFHGSLPGLGMLVG